MPNLFQRFAAAVKPAAKPAAAPDPAYDRALAFVLRMEGCRLPKDTGYVNDPDDPGGATNYGIIQRVYDAYRRRQGLAARPVRAIAWAEVQDIYRRNYWIDSHAVRFAIHGRPNLALAHLDCAVNCGVHQAAKLLQRAAGVEADGRLGPVSHAAITAAAELDLIAAYLELREGFYVGLAERKPVLKKFLRGWLVRLSNVARETGVVYVRPIP